MAAQPALAVHAAPRAQTRIGAALAYLLVGLAAGLPRVLGLGTFLSGDESQFWLHRSAAFLQALRTADWPATAISTHPGVTTMWLGSAGLLLRRALTDAGWLLDQAFPTFITIVRLPTALTHTAALLLGYLMLRRMFAPSMALLAALLWAADPFVVAFSRVLHVDALSGTFMMLSLLAACLYWHHGRRARWLIVSGVCAGLAFLSKSPALALVPAVGLLAFLGARSQGSGARSREPGVRSRSLLAPGSWLLTPGAPLLAWGLIATLTIFALWPALWSSPLAAYRQIQLGVEAEGAQPHMLGNFFLGRQDDAPGPLFYPVALALRLTPLSMLGLLLLVPAWRGARQLERRDMAALAALALITLAALTLFPKKFNRYAEPIFPALDILAAFGLAWGADVLGRLGAGVLGRGRARMSADRWQSIRARPRSSASLMLATQANGTQTSNNAWFSVLGSRLSAVLIGLAALAALANLAWWHPYEIAAYNQALGGARVGANSFATGWGEGLGEVAGWLNAQPDITGVLTVSTMVNGLKEYMLPGAQVITRDGPLPPKAGYVVVYARNVQWDAPWPPFDAFFGREQPLHVVRIHGVDYAWIYRAPPPTARLVQAEFGADLRLHGFDPGDPPVRGQALTYRLVWRALQAPAADYALFAHLIDAAGRRVAQSDLPYPTGSWAAGAYATTELALPLPPDLPAGDYRVVIGLYTPAGRLPLRAATPADPALDGPDALVLDSISIAP